MVADIDPAGEYGRKVGERLRAILMTATAMMAGMLPLALGLGEGGAQSAPLGRAVIGGLILATVATLFFVPLVFSILRRHGAPRSRFADEGGPAEPSAGA